MTQNVNVVQQNVTIDVTNAAPMVNVVETALTLDITSGGVVPAAVDTTLVAATDLSALRAITTNVSGQATYATNADAAGCVVLGMSKTAASAGQNVLVQTSGLVTDASWSWAKGTVWLASNGHLTQTTPTTGQFFVPVGRAITATTIVIEIDTPLEIA